MAKFELYEQVDISLPGREYPIFIARHALDVPQLFLSFVPAKQVLLVTSQRIGPLYLKSLQSVFKTIQCDVVLLKDGEEHKNEASLFAIYEALIQNKHHRDSTLIALGGGVIGDLAGFAASTYQRGMPFIQVPTTLLAQVDASVGGKTAINHPLGKNMIGSFYQPRAVIMDLNTLVSLPIREFRAGLAEVIKYALLVGGDFLTRLFSALQEGLTVNSPVLPHLIAQCCRIKAKFVETDEKEVGQRALLNLGHTFAHALEAYTHYQRWLHGEAVAIGLYCAAVLSYQLGWIDKSVVEQVASLLDYAGLPHKIPRSIELDALRKIMSLDKKIKNNALPFVVMKGLGDCYLDDKITEDCLRNTLQDSQE